LTRIFENLFTGRVVLIKFLQLKKSSKKFAFEKRMANLLEALQIEPGIASGDLSRG
jgi:hypothetical protein